MLNTEVVQGPSSIAETKSLERIGGTNWFFVCMASVLVVIVAVGFVKSFYLRGVIYKGHGVSTLPGYIVLHGVVLTLWFLLFLVQTLLVASGKVRLHRALGLGGATLAAVLFPVSMLVVVRSVVRETPLVVLGDMIILLLYAMLVTAAVWFRQKPEVHKRLMLVASINIVAPAIARWPGAQALLPLSVVGPQLLLYAALIAHDVWSRRRVHSATVWGVASYIVAVGVTIPLASSKLGHALIQTLK